MVPVLSERVIAHTRAWVNRVVIGLNLCPFANAVERRELIRYVVADARTPDALLECLRAETARLIATPITEIETTLLIHPDALTDFRHYNDFLDAAEATVHEIAGEGVLQLASFHPQYQFAGTRPDDVSYAKNRAPFPMLHLLREESVSLALATFPDPDEIYRANVRTLKALGTAGWAALQQQCLDDVQKVSE